MSRIPEGDNPYPIEENQAEGISQPDITSISRSDLQNIPPLDDSEITSEDQAYQEFLRGLAGVPTVRGFGLSSFEVGPQLTIFTDTFPLDDKNLTDGDNTPSDMIARFSMNIRQLQRKPFSLGASFQSLRGKTFEEVAEYKSQDHTEDYPTDEEIKRAQSGERSMDSFGTLLRAAMYPGKLKEPPMFIKFEDDDLPTLEEAEAALERIEESVENRQKAREGKLILGGDEEMARIKINTQSSVDERSEQEMDSAADWGLMVLEENIANGGDIQFPEQGIIMDQSRRKND